MEEEIQVNSITLEELKELLDNYFYTKEESSDRLNSLLEEYKSIKQNEEVEQSQSGTSQVELHNELIQEIKTLQEYSQFGNNLGYFSIVAIGLVLVYVLFYKFLRYFI